jgi:hypothetical protein
MTIVRNVLLACLVISVSASAAVDPVLLNLMMPDATVVSGMQVEASRTSPFGRYVLSQMQSDEEGLRKFIQDTGFDPRRDLSEIVVATGPKGDTTDVLVAGRGVFNPAKILSAAQTAGARTVNYKGVEMLTHDQHNNGALAFVDASIAVMGSVERVKAAIDRRQAQTPSLPAEVLARVQQLSADHDAWFMTTGPLANFFAGKIADPNLNGVMQGNLLQAVLQASGGIKFGQEEVRISGEALTRSEKDATALADVVRFIAGLVQLNRDGDENVKKVATLLETMKLTTEASTMRITFSVPETMMERLFMGTQPERAPSKPSARTRRPAPAAR